MCIFALTTSWLYLAHCLPTTDHVMRCAWTKDDPLMCEYHDKEWGVPVHDDLKHFEFLVLDAFQAGLSWKTVLYKREAFRKAFAGFDPKKVATFTDNKIFVYAGIL